jgi:hypothetical protein
MAQSDFEQINTHPNFSLINPTTTKFKRQVEENRKTLRRRHQGSRIPTHRNPSEPDLLGLTWGH